MDSGLAQSLSSGHALRGPGGAPRNDGGDLRSPDGAGSEIRGHPARIAIPGLRCAPSGLRSFACTHSRHRPRKRAIQYFEAQPGSLNKAARSMAQFCLADNFSDDPG